MCCAPYLGIGCCCGGGGGVTQWSRAHLLMQVSPCTVQKSKFRKLCFFDIATNHNDQPNYVKHILDIIYVFFTLFGDSVCGGGGDQWSRKQPANAVFRLVQLKNRSFQTLFFGHRDHSQ